MTATMAVRQHGTRAMYVVERCRCDDCRQAVREYERERTARIEPAYVSAEPAREHMQFLSTQGVGLKQVAAISGVSTGALSKLIFGDSARGRGPSKRIRPETLAKILAVTPADIADGSRVPAGPVWVQVDRLIAAGVPKAEIGRRCGQGGMSLQLGREVVTAANARAVAEMAAELDAGTLTIVRRSRHGNRTVTIAAPPSEETPVDVVVRRAHDRHERRRFRQIEAGETPDDHAPIVYDDADQFILDFATMLEERQAHPWRSAAACRTRPAWMWFPADGDTVTEAKAKRVCSACGVRAECLAANLERADGIFGGLNAEERQALERAA